MIFVNMVHYEDKNLFNQVYRTAVSLMQARGYNTLCQMIHQSEVSVVNTEYNNWNGGIYGYTVYINLPVKIYAGLSKDEIEDAERTISDSLNEAIKGDEHHYFNTQIAPWFTHSDINWDILGGEAGKAQLKSDLDSLKDLMISVATGGEKIPSVDARYKALHNSIRNRCKQLDIKYENGFAGLWDWYGRWSDGSMPHYQERRVFVNQLLSPTYAVFVTDDTTSSIATPIVELSNWDRIKRTVIKINQDSNTAQNEEDFQKVGLLCRDVIISLAQAVYNKDVHGLTDEKGTVIGKDDAVRMIGNYLAVCLSGSSNEELRAYAKTTNKLANNLTHRRNASKKDMLLCMSATIALINFIGILEDKI